MFDLDHPFFLPLWRRVAVAALCLGWAGLELARGALFWAVLFGGLGLYAAHGFFLRWDDDRVRRRQKEEGR